MRNNGWKVLRVLTTNFCNYECIYCHNEGQGRSFIKQTLSFDEFATVFNAAKKSGFKEVRFSGGEPLSFKETLKMIEFANLNSEMEIGLATNGSLVTEEIASFLGNTRTMVTLHLPGIGDEDYSLVTKRKWKNFERCVELFDKYNVNYSFNFTLYPKIIGSLDRVLEFVIKKGKRIKLLPFLDPNISKLSNDIIPNLCRKFNNMDVVYTFDEKEEYHRWKFKNGAQIKMIVSPCYDKNIEACKYYGEIRVLPDYTLMNCIFGKKITIKNLNENEIIEIFNSLYRQLNTCSEVLV